MPGFDAVPPGHPTLLQGTGAVAFAKGVVGAGGAASDTLIYGFHILANAITAATVTLTGFIDTNGNAASITWTGSTATDTLIIFPAPILNEFAALVATPSVSAKVWLFTGSYNAGGSG
jgi:hypothetical protein